MEFDINNLKHLLYRNGYLSIIVFYKLMQHNNMYLSTKLEVYISNGCYVLMNFAKKKHVSTN